MQASVAFVAKGINDASPVPLYRHFVIGSGHIWSTNGFVTYCAPIALDLRAAVPGTAFKAALAACKEQPRFTLSSNGGKLTIDSGTLSIELDCLADAVTPHAWPSGIRIELPVDIRPALSKVLPFISRDTSRQWACGTKLVGSKLLATNNVVLVEVDLGFACQVPAFISRHFVEAVLRVKTAPMALCLTGTTTAAVYPSGSWIQAANTPSTWAPLEHLLKDNVRVHALPQDFFSSLATLGTLTEEDEVTLGLDSAQVRSKKGAHACALISGLKAKASKWSLQQWLALASIATHADLETYPQPSPFAGHGVRGVIVGKS